MARIGSKVDKESKAIADQNGIPHSTVYYRLSKGWSLQRAITEPSGPSSSNLPRNENGEVISKGLGKARSIRFPQELDDAIDQAIAASGLSQSDFLVEKLVKVLEKELKLK